LLLLLGVAATAAAVTSTVAAATTAASLSPQLLLLLLLFRLHVELLCLSPACLSTQMAARLLLLAGQQLRYSLFTRAC
jgi:hypothetical protein